ncbi:uncharacterized protein LOC119742922 isoform X2 [Patiria miniata]|uniref:Uncharacterized protein n=1 Tax=Patiria miniata TaxID=46514 RepID=A0A914BGU7_PATMI|nr:uncharacterized protein LOC119742922 isoform X2 [Patiria miniata]
MDSPKPLLRLQARQHITALGEEVPSALNKLSASLRQSPDNPSDDILSQAGWSDIEALPDDAFNDEIADGPLTNIPLTDTETPPETEK